MAGDTNVDNVEQVTIAPTPPTVTKTVTHEDPSDLPEINWLWRRIFIFMVTMGAMGHVAWTAYRVTDVQTLRQTIFYDQGLIALMALLYIAGASSEAITRLVGAVRTSRKEILTEEPKP